MFRAGATRSTLCRVQRLAADRSALAPRNARGFAERSGQDEAAGDDARHKEFCKRFVEVLRAAKTEPAKSAANDTAAAEADKELAGEIARLFSASKVTVTPDLLKQRKQLRAEYPELFKGISDSDLDG
ncbi:hypothetical protein H4R19_001023 [Coemansia spiralis]|nr:hypothetical protein H4R19_001023 [Coemansia spiralis]